MWQHGLPPPIYDTNGYPNPNTTDDANVVPFLLWCVRATPPIRRCWYESMMSTKFDQSENTGLSRPKKPIKRKHKTLMVKEKLEVIELLENGKSPSEVVREYGVGKSTVSEIKKNKVRLLEYTASLDKEGIGKRRNLTFCVYPEVEATVYEWFLQERSKGTPMTGQMIRRKAKSFYNQMTEKGSFKASYGWFQNFKERFGIQLNSSEIETSSTDTLSVDVSVKTEPQSTCGDDDELQEPEDAIVKHETLIEPVSQEEAISAFDTCIRWALENNFPLQQLVSLQEMRHQVTMPDKIVKVEKEDDY